jgi:hypothetical protein
MKRKLVSKPAIVIYTVVVMVMIFLLTTRYPEFKKVNSFSIESYENDAIKAHVNITVSNENWFSIDGENIEFTMYYKKRLVAIGQVTEPVTFKRSELTSLPVELDFFPDSMKNDLKEILYADSIQVDIDLSGSFTFLGLRVQKTIPTWLKTDELVNALVARSLEDEGLKLNFIKLKSVSIEENEYQVGFDFKNTLKLQLILKSMQYKIYADDQLKNALANWEFDVNKEIPSKSVKLIEGEVKVNNVASALTGFSKMIKGSLDYYLHGYALVAIHGYEIKIPVHQHFEVDPVRREIILIKDHE